MKLAAKYRAQFAHAQGDRFLFFLAIAAVFHVGLVTLAILFWQAFKANELRQAETEPLPIEFVYLDTPATSTPVPTERRSSVDAIAAGIQQPQPVNAGAPEQAKAPPPSPTTPQPTIAAAKPIPIPKVAALPSIAAPKPTVSSAPKSLTSVPKKPSKSSQAISRPSSLTSKPPQPASQPAPQPTALPSLIPIRPASTPSSLPSPVAASSPPSNPDVEADLPSQRPALAGQGLDGQSISNRTALGTASVDATRDQVLGDYLKALTSKVDQHWQRINIDASRQPIIWFVVNRQGQVMSMKVAQPSGDETADQAALEAIQAAVPFDPLPEQYVGEQLLVKFSFTYRVSQPGTIRP